MMNPARRGHAEATPSAGLAGFGHTNEPEWRTRQTRTTQNRVGFAHVGSSPTSGTNARKHPGTQCVFPGFTVYPMNCCAGYRPASVSLPARQCQPQHEGPDHPRIDGKGRQAAPLEEAQQQGDGQVAADSRRGGPHQH